MKPAKESHSENIPSSVRRVLDILEKSCDVVFLLKKNFESVYSLTSDRIRENFDEILKYAAENFTPGIQEYNYTSNAGKLKMNIFSIGRNDDFILGSGILFSDEKKYGLLWDSHFLKEQPVFSSITEHITNFTSAEINSLPGRAFNLLVEEESEKQKEIINSFIISSQNKLELIYKLKTKTGKTIWMKEMILVQRDKNGHIHHYESSVSEFTRLLEEKTEMNNTLSDLKKLNQAKDQFISVLSHDLKSPYTSILGFSEILLNESALTQKERNEYLSYINMSSQNQLKLINNLLGWSRLMTGRKKIELLKLNLKNVIDNVIANNTRSIQLKNIEIKLTGENYVFAEADERLLDEVLNILVSNAIKYSYQGQTVEIYLNRFRDNQVEVIIKDEGTGMNEKTRERLLKIDKIFSIPGTSGERGTGISLLLANEIVKSHKGDLWFYSEEGRGSEFHFTIPAASNIILLIENNETEKQKICNMLKSAFPEFRCRMEINFYNALDSIRIESPAVIIMAHKLPLMNGLEFLKTLRSDEKFITTPVIVYSGEITDKLKQEYRNAGVNDLLLKPVDLKEIKNILEKNLK